MVRHHVTALTALFVCNLVLTSAHSAPNTALLKLLSAKHSQGLDRNSQPDSYLSHYDNSPSSGAEVPPTNDVNELWLDPNLVPDAEEDSLTSAGSHMTGAEMEGEEDNLTEAVPGKRFHPSAFFGSRGKRTYLPLSYALTKRFQQGFFGSRGKRMSSLMDEAKRFDPSGFSGSRGKRYMPGLEALLLSQMYKKCDISKPFALHHISLALHGRVIPDQCLKAYTQSSFVGEVLKCVRWMLRNGRDSPCWGSMLLEVKEQTLQQAIRHRPEERECAGVMTPDLVTSQHGRCFTKSIASLFCDPESAEKLTSCPRPYMLFFFLTAYLKWGSSVSVFFVRKP